MLFTSIIVRQVKSSFLDDLIGKSYVSGVSRYPTRTEHETLAALVIPGILTVDYKAITIQRTLLDLTCNFSDEDLRITDGELKHSSGDSNFVETGGCFGLDRNFSGLIGIQRHEDPSFASSRNVLQ